MAQIQRQNWVQEKMDLLKDEFVRDDVVDGWFLMSSFRPIFFIIVAYLLFILKLGPKIMEKRKPLRIKKLLIAYDLFQVFFNGWIVWLVLTGVWYFFMSKLADLLDTVRAQYP
ncbi:unnamed protein product [Bemisia tabaci]|uniref:Elongation of very long chain fatty acids protein n=1 Tax=Bemisia tabaci TaxID=7038 RepID=A0A9P0AGD9_BEMTA|nr:unnamed protein product [Bemisia tabaci]